MKKGNEKKKMNVACGTGKITHGKRILVKPGKVLSSARLKPWVGMEMSPSHWLVKEGPCARPLKVSGQRLGLKQTWSVELKANKVKERLGWLGWLASQMLGSPG